MRSWLYRIATNVCFDLLNGKQRRARPVDMGPASTVDVPLGEPIGHESFIEPIPDSRVLPVTSDPAEMAVSRESVRLAFVAALQHLPARQRAVLILREVLRMSAIETAELLDTSVASANSALQRARATLESRDLANHPADPIDESQEALLARYIDAFERYDVDSFVALLHDDAVHSMPPFEMWLTGHDEIARFLLGPGIAMPRLSPGAHLGQRHARVRAVPTERARRHARAVGAARGRDLGRPRRRHHLLPRHRTVLSDVRPAAHAAARHLVVRS